MLTGSADVPHADPTPRTIPLDGGAAAIIDEGEGPPILLVHGLPGSTRDFRYLAPALVDAGQRAIRVDLPGFGASPSRRGLTAADHGAFLAEVIDALGLRRPLVLGHSMGAPYTVALAARWPERLAGIALLAPPGLRPHRGFRRIPSRTVSAWLRVPWKRTLLRKPLRRAFIAGGFRHPYPDEALARTLHLVATFDFEAHVARVEALSVPCWVGWCRDDPLVEDVIVRELADAARAERRLVFTDGGHNPQKPHAQVIAHDLRDWRRDLDTR